LPGDRNLLRRPRSLEALRIQPNTDDIIRARLAETWGFRTRAEIEATARFSRLADELAAVGAAPVVIEGAREAAADEARHRDLCAELAAKWGDSESIKHVAPNVRIGRNDMHPRDRLLWEMVSVCCIAETMNTSLMTRCLEVAKNEEIRKTLRELLRDEVRHARLGWAHLAAERAEGRGAFLADILPMMLEASIEPGFLTGEHQSPWTDACFDYGELPWKELVHIFVDTLELVIFKGLDSMGIDTSKGRAWLSDQVP